MQKIFDKAEMLAKLEKMKELQKSAGLKPKATPTCELCNDEGGFNNSTYDESGYEYKHWKPCECSIKNDVKNIFKSSSISEEFQKKTFDNFILKDRPQSVRDAKYCANSYFEDFNQFRKDQKNSIAICGNPGSGKTHLLMAIANGLIHQGTRVLYFPWVEAFNNLKNDFEKLDERIRHMQEIEVLYIDDLFKGRKEPTDFQVEQIFAVINTRYLNKRPILLSSEKTIDEIIRIDEGLGSRMSEMCSNFTVYMKGENLNYRLREE